MDIDGKHVPVPPISPKHRAPKWQHTRPHQKPLVNWKRLPWGQDSAPKKHDCLHGPEQVIKRHNFNNMTSYNKIPIPKLDLSWVDDPDHSLDTPVDVRCPKEKLLDPKSRRKGSVRNKSGEKDSSKPPLVDAAPMTILEEGNTFLTIRPMDTKTLPPLPEKEKELPNKFSQNCSFSGGGKDLMLRHFQIGAKAGHLIRLPKLEGGPDAAKCTLQTLRPKSGKFAHEKKPLCGVKAREDGRKMSKESKPTTAMDENKMQKKRIEGGKEDQTLFKSTSIVNDTEVISAINVNDTLPMRKAGGDGSTLKHTERGKEILPKHTEGQPDKLPKRTNHRKETLVKRKEQRDDTLTKQTILRDEIELGKATLSKRRECGDKTFQQRTDNGKETPLHRTERKEERRLPRTRHGSETISKRKEHCKETLSQRVEHRDATHVYATPSPRTERTDSTFTDRSDDGDESFPQRTENGKQTLPKRKELQNDTHPMHMEHGDTVVPKNQEGGVDVLQKSTEHKDDHTLIKPTTQGQEILLKRIEPESDILPQCTLEKDTLPTRTVCGDDTIPRNTGPRYEHADEKSQTRAVHGEVPLQLRTECGDDMLPKRTECVDTIVKRTKHGKDTLPKRIQRDDTSLDHTEPELHTIQMRTQRTDDIPAMRTERTNDGHGERLELLEKELGNKKEIRREVLELKKDGTKKTDDVHKTTKVSTKTVSIIRAQSETITNRPGKEKIFQGKRSKSDSVVKVGFQCSTKNKSSASALAEMANELLLPVPLPVMPFEKTPLPDIAATHPESSPVLTPDYGGRKTPDIQTSKEQLSLFSPVEDITPRFALAGTDIAIPEDFDLEEEEFELECETAFIPIQPDETLQKLEILQRELTQRHEEVDQYFKEQTVIDSKMDTILESAEKHHANLMAVNAVNKDMESTIKLLQSEMYETKIDAKNYEISLQREMAEYDYLMNLFASLRKQMPIDFHIKVPLPTNK